ncbi:MAG: hypothetical protein WD845_03515 [Pirellulales bacterium]
MAMDNENSSVGTDSFLDVITNFVGILIILVMVVGDQARHASLPEVKPPDLSELKAAEAEAARIEDEVHAIADQTQVVSAALRARTFERDQVQTVLTAVEHDLGTRRASLDDAERARYDLERDLSLANEELKKLKDDRETASTAAAPQSITIEHRPTPISKTVTGPEARFQLLGGRISYIPLEELLDRMHAGANDYLNRMNTSAEMVETLGPIDGFRMRFMLHRADSPQGVLLQLVHADLLPVSDTLGEPLQEALLPGSKFQHKMAMLSPDRYVITIAVYSDSFAEFQQLKKELYERGYKVAARPLVVGMHVRVGPIGRASAAQ